MISKTITYTDYNGKERTETSWFNLNKAECMEMEFSRNGGLSEYLQRVIDAEDAPTIIQFFKDFVLKAYGEKSEDGKRFIKSEEKSIEFSQTEAYVELYMELSRDAKAAADFVNGVMPNRAEMEGK